MVEITNVMERIVDENMEGVIKEYPDQCRCEFCLADIKALALNKLRSKYVTTAKGNAMVRISSSDVTEQVRVIQAITEAVEIVSKKPRH